LKALELQGFKSFPDKTVLTFDGDITAVVGPNGSGKSNIADAIRWVMGEQSSKALRGGKMEDVIFNGTQQRKRLGYAEVSLILDNAEGRLDREEDEVMVTRRYYRSGESEYYINRASCRLRDIHELFMDTGLGRGGYAMIGQGQIDEILSTRGPERRNVFEEVAGISRYRHRKEEAERKLARTEDNLLRVGDKIAELELQVAPLREQAEKAKQFLAFRDELSGLEISVWLTQLEQLRSGSRKLLSDWEQARRQRDEAAEEQERLYAQAEELAVRMREQDLESEELRCQVTALDEQIQERESALAVMENQSRNSRENAQRLSDELNQQEERADSVAGQIEGHQTRLTEIQTDMDALDADLSRWQEEARKAERSAGQLEEELSALLERDALHSATASEVRELLSGLAAAEQELLDRDTVLKQQLQENAQRLEETEREAAQRRDRLAEARDRCQALKNTVDGYQLRLESRQRSLEQVVGQANQLDMDDNNLRSRIQMLTEMEKVYEGYTKSVKTVMQAAERGQLQGVHGPVAGLLRTEDQYAVAIEIALGGAKQNIVVDREEDGKAAIQYLKRRDAGRATFLPLTSVRPNRLRERGVEQHPGFVGVASELIRYEPQYQTVFARLLGNVVIAEHMDAAIAIARAYQYRFRIVTLDGQVLSPGGSMTGGSTTRSGGILSRAGELERLRGQAERMERRRAEAQRQVAKAEREQQAAAYEMEVARSQKRELDDQALKLEGLCGQTDILLQTLRETRDACKQELAQLARRAEQLEEKRQSARSRMTELEGEKTTLQEELEGKRAGRTSVRERTEAIQTAISELHIRRASLEAERNAANRALEQLRDMERSLSGDQENRRRQMEAYRLHSESLQGQIQEARERLEQLRVQREAQSRQIAGLSQRRLELEAQRSRADRAARDKNQELLNMERECSQLEQKKQAAEMQEKQILDKLWENYSLSYEDARLQRQELESQSKATRRISELKRKISGLGNVNVGAVEEYQRVSERYEFLTGQRDDVQQAKQELETVIGSIAEEMRNIFASQFDRIGKEFSQTFRELFGGGKAALELEDKNDILNCDIEIKVQPPGKTLKVLSLLSGGEKAFVAIALYFSFLKVRPTPFVVMDEIEAALDENNVIRFARYMRSLSEKTQFIVITHRRGTMEEADVLYGVTMQERGISRMLTINLNDVERELHLNEGA
jgi:chromosome segregation protein